MKMTELVGGTRRQGKRWEFFESQRGGGGRDSGKAAWEGGGVGGDAMIILCSLSYHVLPSTCGNTR